MKIYFALVLAMASFFTNAAQAPKRESGDNLTQKYAQFRKTQIKSVNYDLSFEFQKGRELFNGKAVLNVELLRTDSALSIDFLAKTIQSIKINQKLFTGYKNEKGWFEIPAKNLSTKMEIEVQYEDEFNTSGEGISRTVDSEDGSEYIATSFEPYRAHDLFPCFDQPDLKATYKLSVSTPTEWKVISNDLVEDRKESEGVAHTTFKKSLMFSTYLFFLGAGPYQEWTDKEGELPLVIYARKTLAKYVDAERLFDVTKKGLRFYTAYFGMAYPFPKYGQIFIPEFSWGGMEHPGAVSLGEENIFRGAVSTNRMQNRDNLVLHEMAHMWFGDLVTMSWWDDLWLNESFASYVSVLAQVRAMGQQTAWMEFAGDKTWAYTEDQMPTTHPIAALVPDAQGATANFDGITYAKGASALKQLHFYVGEEGLREGLRSYFKEFAFKNTKLGDFFEHIANASKINLDNWVKNWIKTAGPNKVQVKWTCDEDKVNSFSILQSKSSSNTLSPHRSRVGLFKTGPGGKLILADAMDAPYSHANTKISELVGGACPDFVYPNVDDQDYALFSLDKTSQALSTEALAGSLQDPLLRLMMWTTLGQMVRDSELSPTAYFEIVFKALENEKEEKLVGMLTGKYSPIRGPFINYLTVDQRQVLAPKLEALIWKRFEASEEGTSEQLNFFDFYVSIAQSKEGLSKLLNIISDGKAPGGMQLDPERRWSIIRALSRNGENHAATLIDSELNADHSTSGTRAAYAARAAIPDLENKKKYWEEFKKAESIGHNMFEAAAAAFHSPNYPALSQAFVTPFFDIITKMAWNDNESLVEVYFGELFPGNICSKNLLNLSQLKFRQAKNLSSSAKRAWIEANDELARCVRVRIPTDVKENPKSQRIGIHRTR